MSAELDLLNEVVDRGRTLLNGGVVISPELFGRIQQAVTPTADPAMLVHICQRIRAGWLPRRLQAGSWWWGRPRAGGFDLWAQGLVPTMHMVEAMKPEEISAWTATLHPAAPELED